MDTVEVRLRLNVKQLTWNLIVVCDCEGGELLKKNKITKEGRGQSRNGDMTALTAFSGKFHLLPVYCGVVSPRLHMVPLLSCASWTCCRLSVSQQFHHLSCRDCYSSKSNKDFNQSISNSAEIVNFPARWLMEFITKKKKCFVQFCSGARAHRLKPSSALRFMLEHFICGRNRRKKKSWITQVYLVLH